MGIKTLAEIIEQFGNKSYPYIECRCKWTGKDGIEHDDFWGACSYNNVTKKLTPLDGDSYSLNDVYDEWEEEWGNHLIVWEYGESE